jgi:hypothetical protein
VKGGPRAHRGREASSRRGPCANDRPDVALHGLPEGVVDAATLGDLYATFWSGVSHAQTSIEDVFESESDEKVDVRLLLTGTHDGELMRPATSFEHVRESAHCDRARFQDAGRGGRAFSRVRDRVSWDGDRPSRR